MTSAKAAKFQAAIKEAFPEALIEVPEQLTKTMTNDEKDRHVLATAVRAKAETIVTSNLKDFPKESVEPWGVEAQHPDQFLLELCENYTTNVLFQIIQQQAEDMKRPPTTVRELLSRLSKQVPQFAGRLLCYGYGEIIV